MRTNNWLKRNFTWGRAFVLALLMVGGLIGLPQVYPGLQGMQQNPVVTALIVAGIILGAMAGFQALDDDLVREGVIEPIKPQPGYAAS